MPHYLSTNLPSFHQVTSGRGFPGKRHNAHHAGDKYVGDKDEDDKHDDDKHEEGGGGNEDSDEAMAIMIIRRRVD